MKIFFRVLFVLVLGIFAMSASAGSRDGTTGFAAAGINYTFPGSIRIGFKDYEFGLLTPALVGFAKIYDIGPHSYSGFGLGFGSDGNSAELGFHAGIGINYKLFWQIGLRGEIMANAFSNGTTYAHGLLGVSYGF